MKIRALRSFKPAGLPMIPEGSEAEVPDDSDYVAAGLAEEVKPKPKPKTKTKPKA